MTAKIERADMYDGKNRQVLVSSNIQLPSGLALDLRGQLHVDTPLINTKHISYWYIPMTSYRFISNFLLLLNISDHYLYWVDGLLRKVERSRFDGSNREIVTVTPDRYSGLTLDPDFLYLTRKR